MRSASSPALDDPDFYTGDPYHAFRRLREQDPVHWYQAGGFWALTRYDDVLRVSRDPELFSSLRGVLIREVAERNVGEPLPIIYLDPPEHRTWRKLVSASFTPRGVGRLEERVRELAREIVGALPLGEAFDFVEHVAAPLPLLVIAELLGVPTEDAALFKRWTDAGIDLATDTTPEAQQAVGDLVRYLLEVLEHKEKHPGDDIISALVTAQVEGRPLDRAELLVFCITLLIAGNETTRNLMSGGTLAVARYPDQRRTLRDDPALVPRAVEEMLRWWTPVLAFARTATRDTEISGRLVARGDYLVLLYQSANRDERAWGPGAERFDVRRDARHHVAFGFGEHVCLGAHLARLETRALFDELVARCPEVELAGEVGRMRSTLINGITRLPVVLSD